LPFHQPKATGSPESHTHTLSCPHTQPAGFLVPCSGGGRHGGYPASSCSLFSHRPVSN
jgi:hypothetical protein